MVPTGTGKQYYYFISANMASSEKRLVIVHTVGIGTVTYMCKRLYDQMKSDLA